MNGKATSWFFSSKGRRVMSNIASLCAATAAFAHLAPHFLFLDKYQSFLQMYRGGAALPVPDAVLKRANEVLEECNIRKHLGSKYKFFTVVGFDTCSVGSTTLVNGAIIGIPYNFSYEKIEDMDREPFVVHGESVSFGAAQSQKLLNTLILSERAQKFAIAREIHGAETMFHYAKASVAFGAVLLTYSISSALNIKFSLYRLPRGIRLTMYTLSSMFALTTYFMLKDMLTCYYQRKSDETACNMGKDYILGAIEYYEKALAKNIALREILGPKGKEYYTSYGNEEVFLRTKSLPFTTRLDMIKDQMKESEAVK